MWDQFSLFWSSLVLYNVVHGCVWQSTFVENIFSFTLLVYSLNSKQETNNQTISITTRMIINIITSFEVTSLLCSIASTHSTQKITLLWILYQIWVNSNIIYRKKSIFQKHSNKFILTKIVLTVRMSCIGTYLVGTVVHVGTNKQWNLWQDACGRLVDISAKC